MQMGSWKHWAVGSAAALTVMAGGLWAAESVSAAAPWPTAVEVADAQMFQNVGFGPGQMERGTGRFGEVKEKDQALLAEALGISEEQLEAAQDAARTRVRDESLAEAVANGDMTQAQADAMKELEGLWGDRSMGRSQFGGRGGPGVDGDNHDTYLAEALGISVEQLEAAKDTAMRNGITQAVAEGTITQEQADKILTELALKDYVASELEGVLASAVEKAVTDGAITQEQADQIQEDWQGLGGRGMRGDFPGMKGGARGGMKGGFPGGMRGGFGAPDTQSFDGTSIAPGTTL